MVRGDRLCKAGSRVDVAQLTRPGWCGCAGPNGTAKRPRAGG